MSCVGHQGEAADLAAFLRESLTAYRLDAGRSCPAKAVAHFLRREIADRRRTDGNTPELRALLGTVDDEGAALTWVDESGARADLPYGAHGVGAPLVLGLLAAAYAPALPRARAGGGAHEGRGTPRVVRYMFDYIFKFHADLLRKKLKH